MRLKSIVKYYGHDLVKSVAIFYVVMALLIISVNTLVAVSVNEGNGFTGGGDFATAVFIFIVGLNSFKQNFLFLSTNSITRKLQFKGILIAAVLLCGFMALVDITYSNILAQFTDFRSAFNQIYGAWTEQTSGPLIILTSICWSFTVNVAAFLAGYFITNLYYKMTKSLKIIVSVTVPVLITVVYPIIEETVTNGRITQGIIDISRALAGLGESINPFIGVLSLLVLATVAAAMSFLLIRRAVVKK